MGTELTAGNLELVNQRVSAMAVACYLSVVYTSSDMFFALAPSAYQPYYLQVVRRCQQFYDGYVPGLHNNADGIVSSRLGSALCSSLARKIVGSAVGFKNGAGSNDFNAVSWLSHRWAKGNKFTIFCKRSTDYMLGFGTSLIKLNRTADGKYWPDCCRLDDFTFTETADGELKEVRSLIKAYQNVDGLDKDPSSYFLVDHRFFKGQAGVSLWTDSEGKRFMFPKEDRIPYVEYEVVRVMNVGGTQSHQLGNASPVEWDNLPEAVKKAINRDYGAYKIGEPIPLPFSKGCLGAWLLKADGYDGSAPNMPFGKSILRDILIDLAQYDIIQSFASRDINNGQGQVLTPKALDMSDMAQQVVRKADGTETTMTIANDPYSPRSANYQMPDGQDINSNKPIVNQFDLRADQWRALLDGKLRDIATKLNLSPKVLSASLAQDQPSQKTATEVDSDDDSTVDWVETMRGCVADQLNELIEELLSVNGINGNAEVKFGNVGLRSKAKALADIQVELQNHLITTEEAIRELHPEMDEDQIQLLIAKCNAEKQADKESQPLFPDLGGN